MGRQYKNDYKNDYLIAQLLVLFPGGDPGYFRSCLGYYETAPVERIAEKIFNNGGHYPRLITNDNSNGDNIIHNNRTQQLNQALRLLATEFFPDCNVAYIREKLLKYEHSYVEQVANELLQDKAYPERLEYGKLDRSDLIKSDTYRIHAEAQLAIDYPQIWKSSIRAVLAENNWDYVKSYDQLQDMGSGGFWTTIRNFFRHWSFPSTSSSTSLSIIPSTSSSSPSKIFNNNPNKKDDDKDDDNKEFEHDLQIIRRRALDIQSKEDAKIALEINEHEYDELITCQCCYGDYVIEQLTFCSEGTHVFCHECIQHYISEGLFGQGSLRGAARIPCISMENDCDGCFQHDILEKTVLSQDVWSAYQKSIFEENLRHSKIARCSACGYCELDESTLPLDMALQRLNIMMMAARWIMWNLKEDIETVYDRIACARRGSIFQCRNPECRRLTCVLCQHIVRGLHKCWEKEQDGLRLYVEKAMADAVKRTCPVCGLSFQKEDGCNKIVCRCGYTMCYVCRKDIRKESYAHFCDHFRNMPGAPCDRCKKCDLYKTDPEDEAVTRAANKARREYLRAHPEVAASQPNHVIIGPISTFEKLNDWGHESMLWVLQQALDFIV